MMRKKIIPIMLIAASMFAGCADIKPLTENTEQISDGSTFEFKQAQKNESCVDENEVSAGNTVYDENIKNTVFTSTFSKAPDGTSVRINFDETLQPDVGDINSGEVTETGVVMDRLKFGQYYVLVGYVDYSQSSKLENLSFIFNADNDTIKTDVIEKDGIKASQMYFDVEGEQFYMPITCAYKKSAEGYIYIMFVDEIFMADTSDEDMMKAIAGTNDDLKQQTIDCFEKYITITTPK